MLHKYGPLTTSEVTHSFLTGEDRWRIDEYQGQKQTSELVIRFLNCVCFMTLRDVHILALKV